MLGVARCPVEAMLPAIKVRLDSAEGDGGREGWGKGMRCILCVHLHDYDSQVEGNGYRVEVITVGSMAFPAVGTK